MIVLKKGFYLIIRLVLIYFLINSFNFVFSQNLVNNGGFEDNTTNNFNGLEYWKKCVFSDTPDYFNDSIFSVIFSKYIGNATSNSGKACAGIFTYRSSLYGKKKTIREYIQVSLNDTLQKDSIYNFELYILLDQESNVLCNSFAMYFSPSEISYTNTNELLSTTPQIIFSLSDYSINNNDWSRIQGTYKANGGETFIVLGNFDSNENSEIEFLEKYYDNHKKTKWNLNDEEFATYIYIDDIAIVSCDTCNKVKTKTVELPEAETENEKFIANEVADIDTTSITLLETEIIIKKPLVKDVEKSNSDTNTAKKDVQKDSLNYFNLQRKDIREKGTVILKNVQFEYNKSKFTELSIIELNNLLRFLRNNADLKIKIWGHTDNNGSIEYNISLSYKRAKAVETFLITHGINKNRIQSYGYGSSTPIADNNTIEGQAQNRRVEFRITQE